jgi:lipopolysaccharide/colanic/teichoic acid biosynthesis glycosyltransferase
MSQERISPTSVSASEVDAAGSIIGSLGQAVGVKASIMKDPLTNISVPAGHVPMDGTAIRILNEQSFQHAISVERKRAERSRRSFLLVLLDLGSLRQGGSQRLLPKVVSLLRLVRETDVTGWQKNDAILGIIFTEIPSEGRSSIVGTILSRISGVLYNNLTFDQFNQITISHYLFPEQWDYDVAQRPSAPTLYPDLEKRDNANRLYMVTKRAIDTVASALGLLVLAPLFLAIAMAIKLTSKGPVFFRQQRVGQFGTPFEFLKFRSMYLNNDTKIHREYVRQLISGKAERQPSNGNGQGVYKLTADPRVTRVGAFLRKTSMDELPQLINVLRGEMSLVGPRPAIPYEVEAYQIWHRRRVLEAKPGITGLWQVSGRSRVGFDEMVRLDVRYASQRSFWLDMKILLMTPRAVILGDGAY